MKLALTAKLKHGVLYEFMHRMGWNQAEFARQLGIGATPLSNYMTLKTPMSVAMAQRIAAFIGCSPDELRPNAEEAAALEQFPREIAVIRDIPLLEWHKNHPVLPGPERAYDTQERRDVITKLLEILSPKHAKVLELRFGLNGNDPQTLSEIGKFFGLSPERIRGIEQYALHKLRHPSYLARVKEFTNIDE